MQQATHEGHKTHSYAEEKKMLLARLRRIEGQAHGIVRMVEEDRYCLDIVQQLTALASAAQEVSLLVLEGHIEGCVADAIRDQRGDTAIKELMGVLRKAIRK